MSERAPARLSLHEAAAFEGAFPGKRKGRRSQGLVRKARSREVGRSDSAFILYAREIGRVEPLTPSEENELAVRAYRGDKAAREQLLKASLPLVVQLAHEFENIGLPLLDLVSEGNLGLMKALERFEPGKAESFSAFATWWVKQAMKRALGSASRMAGGPAAKAD